MHGLVELVFNTELTLIIGIVASFILGFLLFLIKIPDTDYSRKIARAKNTISACFFVCSIMMLTCLRYSGIPDYDRFSSMMMFVITSVSSVVLSYSLINVLEDNFIDRDKFWLNLGVVIALSFLLIKSLSWETAWGRNTVLYGCVALFLFNCTAHVLLFAKVYRKCMKTIEQFYDEEYDQRLRWIKFCYVIMMLTQIFVLVYMVLPRGFMKFYVLWYSLFMLYFSANFLSFIGSHKFMLDAFAYKTLSGQDLKRKLDENRKSKLVKSAEPVEGQQNVADDTDEEFRKLEKSLEKWVAQKSFREYDRTRDQIAADLGTSKEFLHFYFTNKIGVDFRTWRTNLRIEEAKRLLLEKKDASINIIAEVSGFSDKSNFHRQFVKIVGCSPKQWRDSDGNPDRI